MKVSFNFEKDGILCYIIIWVIVKVLKFLVELFCFKEYFWGLIIYILMIGN